MKYRRFGRTELQMPVFSCGGMRFQQDWTDLDFEKITAENQAKLESCIQRALEVGINHIETARGYASIETVSRIEERFTATADKLIARLDVLAEAFNRLAGRLDGRQ